MNIPLSSLIVKNPWLNEYKYDYDLLIKTLNDKLVLAHSISQHNIGNIISTSINTGLNDLKSDIYKQLSTNESKLDTISNNLIIRKNNSSIKGKVGENKFIDILNNHFPDMKYEMKANESHKGDFWLIINNKTIIVDIKDYKNTVPSKEKNKLKRDMKIHEKKFGILISYNSNISFCKRDIDIDIENGTYILYIQNALDNMKIPYAIRLFSVFIELLESDNMAYMTDNEYRNLINESYIDFRNTFSLFENTLKTFLKSRNIITNELRNIEDNLLNMKYRFKVMLQRIFDKLKSTLDNDTSITENNDINIMKKNELILLLENIYTKKNISYKNLNKESKNGLKDLLIEAYDL